MESVFDQKTPEPVFDDAPVKLTIRGLCKSYSTENSGVVSLDNIYLDILRGELLCIIGESGCGKSTLLQILAGFDSQFSGEVKVDGEPILGPSYRRSIVFQHLSLLPWMNVQENVSLGLDIRSIPDDGTRVQHFIDLVGLRGFERSYPKHLSGGMAQRVAIARALVNDKDLDVLLLDEPFSALDAFTRIRLQEEFVRIWARSQYTTVFVTHDIDEAVFLGTRVVVLTPRPGRVARIFNVPLRRPRDRTSVEFLRMRGMIAQEFAALVRKDELRTEPPPHRIILG